MDKMQQNKHHYTVGCIAALLALYASTVLVFLSSDWMMLLAQPVLALCIVVFAWTVIVRLVFCNFKGAVHRSLLRAVSTTFFMPAWVLLSAYFATNAAYNLETALNALSYVNSIALNAALLALVPVVVLVRGLIAIVRAARHWRETARTNSFLYSAVPFFMAVAMFAIECHVCYELAQIYVLS